MASLNMIAYPAPHFMQTALRWYYFCVWRDDDINYIGFS
jgi:hypothetical protein